MYGDRVGRGRMQSNGKGLRNAYTARGTCITTGEVIPNIPLSRLARSIFIPVNSKSINWDKLTDLQNNREMLAFCMMTYIKWIIKNEMEIRNIANEEMAKLQKSQNNHIHGRTNEAINVMIIGYGFFLRFLQDYGVIQEEKKQNLINEAMQILIEISNNQQNEIEANNPINLFYIAIDELLHTKKIYLLDYKTALPINKENNSRLVGYLDGEKGRYYLFQGAIYNEVCRFYSINGSKFPLSALTLWRYLQDEGLLYMTDSSRKTVERTDAITKKKVRVLDIEIKTMASEAERELNQIQQQSKLDTQEVQQV